MEKQKQRLESRGLHRFAADQVEIIFYTDPLCCWSWAWRPHLEHLKAMLGDQASWDLKMGGLIPDWKHFTDGINAVTRPAQMGPVWMHAGQLAGRPISCQLWHKDPPASSYPCCIAVKCAAWQSVELGFQMLSLLQDACMQEGRNIARKDVLRDVAKLLATNNSFFDVAQFTDDFENDVGRNLLRADLDAVKKYTITRFPSLIIRSGGKTLLVPGHRQSATIFDAIKNISPGLMDYSAL
jgi:putative protein-disulfide isomerase